jgi:hypothetical protein
LLPANQARRLSAILMSIRSPSLEDYSKSWFRRYGGTLCQNRSLPAEHFKKSKSKGENTHKLRNHRTRGGFSWFQSALYVDLLGLASIDQAHRVLILGPV